MGQRPTGASRIRDGQGKPAGCTAQLGQLRADLLPLELWLRSDPELADGLTVALTVATASAADDAGSDRPPSALPGPPRFIAGYLAAEQALGRLRSTVIRTTSRAAAGRVVRNRHDAHW